MASLDGRSPPPQLERVFETLPANEQFITTTLEMSALQRERFAIVRLHAVAHGSIGFVALRDSGASPIEIPVGLLGEIGQRLVSSS